MLTDHPFTQQVLEDNRVVMAATHTVDPVTRRITERAVDEYEFYIGRVGNRLVHLLGLLIQLSEAITFIEMKRIPKGLKRSDLTRHSFLLFCIENFLIRTTSLHDRSLKVVDAVLHLGLDLRDIRHTTISRNVHLAGSQIPRTLNRVRDFAQRYAESRNTIIHHSSYSEDALYRLDLFEQLLASMRDNNEPLTGIMRSLPQMVNEVVQELRSHKATEFQNFCRDAEARISDLLDALVPLYSRQKSRLLLVCGYGSTYSHANNSGG